MSMSPEFDGLLTAHEYVLVEHLDAFTLAGQLIGGARAATADCEQ